jgi:Zn-dependent peptidase ImmA (M78 family)
MRDEEIEQPSANLLDTIFQVQQRQEWYRDHAIAVGETPVSLINSFTRKTPVVTAAAVMRAALNFGVQDRGANWSEAFRRLAENAEELGILVMVSGIVGSNTHRTLDPREFRGFALLDRYAPIVFVNGADTKAAQIFTLAHELAHVWLGQSALTDANESVIPQNEVERWCNEVAAEMLVPLEMLRREYNDSGNFVKELSRLAKRFKVSTLVILRRLRDAGFLGWEEYRSAYQAELNRVLAFLEVPGGTGGNFYNTQVVRTSKRFTRAVITSTLEGQTLYRDAFRMLGFKKASTFNELAHRLEVV